MLKVDPLTRASIPEIISHPWMRLESHIKKSSLFNTSSITPTTPVALIASLPAKVTGRVMEVLSLTKFIPLKKSNNVTASTTTTTSTSDTTSIDMDSKEITAVSTYANVSPSETIVIDTIGMKKDIQGQGQGQREHVNKGDVTDNLSMFFTPDGAPILQNQNQNQFQTLDQNQNQFQTLNQTQNQTQNKFQNRISYSPDSPTDLRNSSSSSGGPIFTSDINTVHSTDFVNVNYNYNSDIVPVSPLGSVRNSPMTTPRCDSNDKNQNQKNSPATVINLNDLSYQNKNGHEIGNGIGNQNGDQNGNENNNYDNNQSDSENNGVNFFITEDPGPTFQGSIESKLMEVKSRRSNFANSRSVSDVPVRSTFFFCRFFLLFFFRIFVYYFVYLLFLYELIL